MWFPLLCFACQLSATVYRVVGYYENWAQYWTSYDGGKYASSPSTISPYLQGLTTFNYAFAFFHYGSLNGGNNVVQPDWGIYPSEWDDINQYPPPVSFWTQATDLKNTYPDMSVILSIGGWNFCTNGAGTYGYITYSFFSELVANSTYTDQFIASALTICNSDTYPFDGIDIDWEYPACAGEHGGSGADYQNFLNFLSALSTALHGNFERPLLLTMTAPSVIPVSQGLVNGSYMFDGMMYSVNISDPSTYYQWLAHCATYVDWINLLNYDYYGPGYAPQNNTVTGDNAPFASYPTTANFSVQQTVSNYLSAGIPSDKLVVGIPTYGHTYVGLQTPSQWDPTQAPNGPGCPFTGADAPGPLTSQEGYLSYIEICQYLPDTSASPISYTQSAFQLSSTTSVPIYSYQLSSSTLAVNLDASTYYTTAQYNPDTQTWYAYNLQSGKWVSFDAPLNPPYNPSGLSSVAVKCQYIRDNSLGGAMIWALDEDTYLGSTPSILQTVVDQLSPEESGKQ